jgi:hypothetical protein
MCSPIGGKDASTSSHACSTTKTHSSAKANGWSVSHCASDALDTLMGTEFMAKRRGSLATFPDGPQDPAAVRQHAIEYLKKVRENE